LWLKVVQETATLNKVSNEIILGVLSVKISILICRNASIVEKTLLLLIVFFAGLFLGNET